MNMSGDQESGPGEYPLPEYRPGTHPYVLFRAHSSEGRSSIVFLGGEEFWVSGTWMVQAGSRIVILRDRLFRVSELTTGLPTSDIIAQAAEFHASVIN